jgi:protein-S-isoprenylcysteine O-methyltransferase Ste14
VNEAVPIWMQVAMGALALIALFFFGPRVKEAVQNSPKGSAKDWLGLLLPIGGVVLFVLVLIALLQD